MIPIDLFKKNAITLGLPNAMVGNTYVEYVSNTKIYNGVSNTNDVSITSSVYAVK